MFEEKGYSTNDIKFMATTSGPGSLTGLRICMSTIKTISQVLNVPIVTLPTLYALEMSYLTKDTDAFKKIYSILMARKNHYYIRELAQPIKSFDLVKGEDLEEILDDSSLYIVEENSTPAMFCDKNNINFVNIELNPEIIIDLCLLNFNSGIFQNYSECLPEYGGKSVAEVNFEKRNKGNVL
jgi:tRNA threonylcarbamoyl adenosine modification protein YeaZ